MNEIEKMAEDIKAKPSWYKDLKWVFGLVFFFSFGLTQLAYNFVWITEEERAIEVNAALMAASLSRGGLDDTSDIEEVRRMLVQSGEDRFQPIPGVDLFVTKDEIDAVLKSSSPRQARIDFFKNFSRPLYKEGAEGLASLSDDPKLKQQILEGAGPLAVLSYRNHLLARKIFAVLAAVSAISLFFLVFFSRRFGRLSVPGVIILISTLPWFALTALLSFGFAKKVTEAKPISEETESMNVVMNVAANVLADPMKTISGRYLAVTLVGIGLIVMAIFGRATLAIVRKIRRTP